MISSPATLRDVHLDRQLSAVAAAHQLPLYTVTVTADDFDGIADLVAMPVPAPWKAPEYV